MENNGGYTKRWRKRWDKGYHRDRILWVLMDYLIDHVNFKDEEKYNPQYGMLKLSRGQGIFGRKMLAKKLGVGEQQIRTRLDFLKSIDFLTIKTTNRFSIITVLNYDKYQGNGHSEQPTDQPAGNQQVTTLEVMLKKDNKDIRAKYPKDFSEFWSNYPLKKGKAKAYQSWKKHEKQSTLPTLEKILNAIDMQKQEKAYLRERNEFCPEWKHPATWLNQECWDDEVDLPEMVAI